MVTTRAPSLELLRALRSFTTASSTVSKARRSRINPCSIKSHACGSILRTSSFTTSTRYHLASSQTPSTALQTGGQNPQVDKTNKYAPTSHDRGPTSDEDTQTDFGIMDIYNNTPEPATSVDACTSNGFHLNNGVKVTDAAVLLAGGEAWSWKPWLAIQSSSSAPKISDMLDARRGLLKIPKEALGVLALLHPKPDLLLLGTGSKNWMLEAGTKKYVMEELGIRVDVMDTANASAAYNLLAKERGVDTGSSVAGAFLPIGWQGPQGAGRKR